MLVDVFLSSKKKREKCYFSEELKVESVEDAS